MAGLNLDLELLESYRDCCPEWLAGKYAFPRLQGARRAAPDGGAVPERSQAAAGAAAAAGEEAAAAGEEGQAPVVD